MDNKYVIPGAIATGALAIWYLWCNKGETHNVEIDNAYSPNSFNAYAHWQGHGGRDSAYVHHYPDKVAPNCIPLIYQTEEGAISTTGNAGIDLSAGQNGNYNG